MAPNLTFILDYSALIQVLFGSWATTSLILSDYRVFQVTDRFATRFADRLADKLTDKVTESVERNRMAISSPNLRMWGRFEHSLDEKGRVIVPQKFREKLGEEFVLTIGPERHIRAYPMPVWEAMEEQLVSIDVHDELNPDLIFLQRMFGNCEFVGSDPQNRLNIPRHLREWANLREGEAAIIIGSGTRLEFWSRATWDTYSKGFTEQRAAEAAQGRKDSQNRDAANHSQNGAPNGASGQTNTNGTNGSSSSNNENPGAGTSNSG